MSDKELIKQLEEVIVDKHKEIERLRLELSGYRQAILQDKEMLGLKQDNQRLQSIIKEVREYINDNVMVYAFNDKKFPHWEFNDDNINDILEILDKENI